MCVVCVLVSLVSVACVAEVNGVCVCTDKARASKARYHIFSWYEISCFNSLSRPVSSLCSEKLLNTS